MRISIASDHAGFEQKQQLVDYLVSRGHDVADRGPDSDDRVDYPDYAVLVAGDVAEGRADRGVLVCGTGIGMAMAADKVAGVRAANIVTPEFAALCREHNDANVIALSGRFVELSRCVSRNRVRRGPSCGPCREDHGPRRVLAERLSERGRRPNAFLAPPFADGRKMV